MKSKVIAIFLTLAMCFSMVSFATASGSDHSVQSTKTFYAGSSTSMVILDNGELWGWGDAEYGKMGNGFTKREDRKDGPNSRVQRIPIKIMDDAVQISVGENHVLVLKNDNTLWAFGDNSFGQLGIIGPDPKQNSFYEHDIEPRYGYYPIKVMDNVKEIAAGGYFSMAVTLDGNLWSWGRNDYGQVGNNQARNMISYGYLCMTYPVKIMENVSKISAGGSFSMAVKTDGTLYGWGINSYSQLGNGYEGDIWQKNDSTTKEINPVKIADNILDVSCGFSHTVAITKDRRLLVWGNNQYGQMGFGTMAEAFPDRSESTRFQRMSPYVVTEPTEIAKNITFADAGGYNTMFIKSDSTLWGMGINGYGELGIGYNGQKPNEIQGYVCNPVKIMDNVSAVNCGFSHTLAMKTDQTLLGWGTNSYSELLESSGGIYKNKFAKVITYPVKLIDKVKMPSNGLVNAVPNKSSILLDGNTLSLDMYTIYDGSGGGTNYIKLRDLASAISGTKAQFDVSWNQEKQTISLATKSTYTAVVGEMQTADGANKIGIPNFSPISMDGNEIELQAYTIDSSNYFKLRDLGRALGFNVNWDSKTGSVSVNTNEPYVGTK